MNIIQRIFAKKIKGEELKNLVETLGVIENVRTELLNHEGPYLSVKSYGKLYAQSSKKGIEIDLEISAKEKAYGSFANQGERIFSQIGAPRITKYTFQIKKTIPYDELKKII